MNLTEFRKLVTPKIIAANWTEAPVSLMPSAFDAKATFRGREGVKLLETEMPFFREGFKIKEKDRQEILRIQEKNDPYLTDALNRVFDDAGNLLEGALVVAEREIMQLLFAENGVNYTYDYDPGDEWKTNNYVTVGSSYTWDKADAADPLGDIQTAQDKIKAQGGSGDIIIMNNDTFKLFRKIAAIKNLFISISGVATPYLTDAQIVNILKEALGLAGIVVYDKQYKDESGVTHKFVPNGYVAVIPNGTLGNTWRGTTPEEADLMGSGQAEVAVVNNGIALTQILDAHPVNLNTFASEIVLPSFERMNEFALIKVL